MTSWSAEIAWVVGLMATDGNLSRDGRHLTLVSADLDLLETVRVTLGLASRIGRSGGARGHVYRLQWSDRRFYDWLVRIGLTPAKSLTLGPLHVPDEHFRHFLRGCIDGDGSIVTYTDRYNTFKSSAYVYTRLYVSVVSASPRFPEWLRATARRLRGLSGSLSVRRTDGRHDLWRLRYAKGESLALLRWIYAAPDGPSLARKRAVAAPFLPRPEGPARPRTGRPMVL